MMLKPLFEGAFLPHIGSFKAVARAAQKGINCIAKVRIFWQVCGCVSPFSYASARNVFE